MVRVAVELFLGSRKSSRTTLAAVDIGNISGGPLADYRVLMTDEDSCSPVDKGTIPTYQHWSASVLDLMVRR